MSASVPSRVRAPVSRVGADRYLLLMLLSFGSSVVLTRVFLELTGYPQLGSGELHIAHVLWGGLFLFSAVLVMLIMSNRWVYSLAAMLGGVGVGLFIDEVGKFITATNDYFHPAAAPIIYATFLITVLIYVRVSKPRESDDRTELYWSLTAVQEVLDHDLEQFEYKQIEAQLISVSKRTKSPIYKALSDNLLDFMHSEYVEIVSVEPSWWARAFEKLQTWRVRWLTTARLKAVLVGGLLAVGFWELIDLIQLLIAARDPGQLQAMVEMWTELGDIASISSIFWFSGRVVVEGSVGVLMIFSAGLLVLGRERSGVDLAVLTLIFALTAANLVAFYVDQFSMIFTAMIQFILLVGALLLQERKNNEAAGSDQGPA